MYMDYKFVTVMARLEQRRRYVRSAFSHDLIRSGPIPSESAWSGAATLPVDSDYNRLFDLLYLWLSISNDFSSV
jgi:hypothetical protein